MLNVPSLTEMLTIIGVALFTTAALITALASMLFRTREQAATTAPPRIPAQRSSSRPAPVSTR